MTKFKSLALILTGVLVIAECELLDWFSIFGTETTQTPVQHKNASPASTTVVPDGLSRSENCHPEQLPQIYGGRVLQPLLSMGFNMFPNWNFSVPCLVRNIVNMEILYRVMSLIEEIALPCMDRKPAPSACKKDATYQSTRQDKDYVSPLEWPCLYKTLKFNEFYEKLYEVYKLVNPCTTNAPKLSITQDKNATSIKIDSALGDWIHGLWWFWWYFLSNQVVFILSRRNQEDISTTQYHEGKIFGDALDPSVPTKIIVHGYYNSQHSIINHLFRTAFLYPHKDETEEVPKRNVIVVDWSSFSYEFYTLSRFKIIYVASAITTFIVRLIIEYRLNLDTVHIIGHSLGAHIAGIVGNLIIDGKIARQSGLKSEKRIVGHITGLDPAQVLFKITPKKWRIGQYSAKFVDVLHTSDYSFGLAESTGHVDFYLNGGLPLQPGCGIGGILGIKRISLSNIAIQCAHARSIFYYVEALVFPKAFLAVKCSSAFKFYAGLCRGNPTAYIGEKESRTGHRMLGIQSWFDSAGYSQSTFSWLYIKDLLISVTLPALLVLSGTLTTCGYADGVEFEGSNFLPGAKENGSNWTGWLYDLSGSHLLSKGIKHLERMRKYIGGLEPWKNSTRSASKINSPKSTDHGEWIPDNIMFIPSILQHGASHFKKTIHRIVDRTIKWKKERIAKILKHLDGKRWLAGLRKFFPFLSGRITEEENKKERSELLNNRRRALCPNQTRNSRRGITDWAPGSNSTGATVPPFMNTLTSSLNSVLNVTCIFESFGNFSLFSRVLDLVENLVYPCRNRRPSANECYWNGTIQSLINIFRDEDYVSPAEWPCLQSSLSVEDFYNNLREMYEYLNPCAPKAPKVKIRYGNKSLLKKNPELSYFIYGIWWFWWYFLSEQVVFELHQRGRKPILTTVYEKGLIFGREFYSHRPTKIMIHGYVNFKGSIMNTALTNEYIRHFDERGRKDYCTKYNLIIVDWSSLSFEPYPITRYRIVPVAKACARLIWRLVNEYGIKLKSIHIIGHSLGAHISGITGNILNEAQPGRKNHKPIKNPKIGRITGLDPALPLFVTTPNKWRIGYYSARFVDIIHTSMYSFGIASRAGHADFYVNGGIPAQPGCGVGGVVGVSAAGLLEFDAVCAHYRSILYFAESINRPRAFKARKCESMAKMNKGECDDNSTSYMGDHASKKSRGSYYLKTGGEPPYGLGAAGIKSGAK